MRMRDVAALVVPLTLMACGGHSTPLAPDPPPTAVFLDLQSGSYGLTLTMSAQGEPVCNGGICTSISLCVATGSPPAVSTFATVVRLDRSGDAVTIRPEDPSATFRLDLHIAGSALSGTASGQFRDGALQVLVASGNGQGAAATGSVLATSVAGRIDGQVGTGEYSCSNNGHSWTLAPR